MFARRRARDCGDAVQPEGHQWIDVAADVGAQTLLDVTEQVN